MEVAIIKFIQLVPDSIGHPIAGMFSTLADWPFLTLYILAFWFPTRGLKASVRLVAVTLIALGLNLLLKEAFESMRPFVAHPELYNGVYEKGYSFPSGHSMVGAAFWMWVCVENWMAHSWYTKIPIINVVIVFGAGLSRIYFGVHYPIDVLAGWALGGLLVSAVHCVWLSWKDTLE